MMIKTMMPVLAAGLLATACDTTSDMAPAPAADDRLMYAMMDGGMETAHLRMEEMAQEAPPSPSSEPVEQYIAYAYSYSLEFIPERPEPAMARHRDRCLSAGPEICQVIHASASKQSGDRSSARLQLRAVPGWVQEFRDGLSADVDEGDGTIRASNMNAADLTRPILDATARLDAKRALLDRLNGLLERPDADVEALIRLEREIARVQGEIESGDANLRAMRARVSMSRIDLDYSTRYSPTGGGAFDPIGRAISNAARNFAGGLGDVITFVAVAAPWMILVIPVLWLLLRWRKKVSARKRANAGG